MNIFGIWTVGQKITKDVTKGFCTVIGFFFSFLTLYCEGGLVY